MWQKSHISFDIITISLGHIVARKAYLSSERTISMSMAFYIHHRNPNWTFYGQSGIIDKMSMLRNYRQDKGFFIDVQGW